MEEGRRLEKTTVQVGPDPDLEKEAGSPPNPSSENGITQKAKDPNLVEFDGPDDPGNPQNFPKSKKWLITVVYSSLTMWVQFSSSVFSTASGVTSEEFHVSTEVMTLGTSLPVLVCPPFEIPRLQKEDFISTERTGANESNLGVRVWSFDLGPHVGTLWSIQATIHRLHHFHHFPNPRGRFSEPADHFHLPIFPGVLWLFDTSDHCRWYGRFLGTSGSGGSHFVSNRCYFRWAYLWTNYVGLLALYV